MSATMARASQGGQLSASMAILGLVVQQPDSIAGVGRRLSERYPHARFARNAAHNNIPSLNRQGFVRLVEHGKQSALDRYEATEQGRVRLLTWMRSQGRPPVVRDALRATLEQLDDEAELLQILEGVRQQEQACLAEREAASARMRARQRSGETSSAEIAGWQRAVHAALIADEVMLWGQRAMRLKHLRECLQCADH
jgi:DNA-binding PadR family transcriptional regulator